jgi:uncharacterized damage-inducible protein DinB
MNPEQARTIADHYATVMEQEFGTTCKVLAAVRDDARDYRPDDKSRTAWQLATHLATGDVWFLESILNGQFAWDPDSEAKAEKAFKNVAEVVAYYKATIPEKLKALRAASSENLTRPVDFFGKFTQPAVGWLSMANNHGIHHRGQLASYLRASGSKVPAMYGPSADEPMA